jgi:hypothetical protein
MAERPIPQRGNRSDLSAESVRSALDYNTETGVFVWKYRFNYKLNWNRRCAGKTAGHLDRLGYIVIGFEGRLRQAHRIAWLYVTGRWPEFQIDHVNLIRHDNRFVNLREATPSENMANTKAHKDGLSGFKGVTWCKDKCRWQTQIMVEGVTYRLGRFDTAEEAHEVYKEAAHRLRGKFART